MDNMKEIFCGLCLNTINDQNFEVIEKNKARMLEVLFPNLQFNQEIKHLTCNECSEKVLAAFEFKLMCINTENTIVSYVDVQKKSPIDLIEIFTKENGEEILTNKLDNQKLCRLCMNLVTDKFVPFHEIKTEVIHLYIPDVNFNITKDPVICKQCLNSLTIHTSFIRNCKNAQEKRVCNKNNNKTQAGLFDSCVKSENIVVKLEENEEGNLMEDYEFETELKEELIECEDIKIKCEGNEENRIQFHFNNSNETMLVNGITENKNFAEKFVAVKCEAYNYNSRSGSDVETYISIHKKPPDMLKCTSCDYKSDNSQTMDKHMLIHSDPSEIQTCICGLCNDKSKLALEKMIESETILGRDSPQSNPYACVLCGFQTTRRYAFKRHAWSHKDPSSRPFGCESCDYKARSQSDLKRHKIKHTDPLKLNMFKCTLCAYQAKVKADLKKHLTRRHSEETETYKCYM